MKISEFNKSNGGNVRIAQVSAYKGQAKTTVRYMVQVWCPQLNRWTRHLPNINMIVYRNEAEAANNSDETRIVPNFVFAGLGRPAIIIDKDDHGVSYYSAMNTEEAAITFLKLLQERKEQVSYMSTDEPVAPRHKPEEFEDDDDLKEACLDQWATYNREVEWHRESRQVKEDVEKALQTRDGYLAYIALQSLNGEGDRVSIETLSTVDVSELEEVNGTVGNPSANTI